MEWADDNPYFLLLVALEKDENGNHENLILDVGLPGWQKTYADWLDRPAEWYLCEKTGEKKVVIVQFVYAGEKPYYVKKHIGQLKFGTGRYRHIAVYGIGKKIPARFSNGQKIADERYERVWVLPHGVTCAGEDVEKIALSVVSTMEWQKDPEPPQIEERNADQEQPDSVT